MKKAQSLVAAVLALLCCLMILVSADIKDVPVPDQEAPSEVPQVVSAPTVAPSVAHSPSKKSTRSPSKARTPKVSHSPTPHSLSSTDSPSVASPSPQCLSNASCLSNHSYCDINTTSCVCVENYYGVNCSVFCTEETNCSSRGTCNSDGLCACNVMWRGHDCKNPWLLATVASVMGLLLIVSIVMVGCFIKNSCCDSAEAQGYYPIQ